MLERSGGGDVHNASALIAIGLGSDGYRHISHVAEAEKENLGA